jgi:hypothetical protein
MVLLNHVKQCKKCDFYLGRERDFIIFLVMGKPNGPLQKKKEKSPIQTSVLWDAPQRIELISINHHKLISKLL